MEKYTLITGACGGLGRAFVKMIASAGENLVLVGTSKSKLDDLIKENKDTSLRECLDADIIDYMIDEEADANDFTYLFEGADGKTNEALRKSLEEAGIDLTSLQIHEISMPSADKAERLVEMTDFGEKQDIVVKMWTRVKALPLGIEVIIFSICLVIAIVGMIAYSIYKKVENKKLVAGKIEQMGNSTAAVSGNFFSNISTKIQNCILK